MPTPTPMPSLNLDPNSIQQANSSFISIFSVVLIALALIVLITVIFYFIKHRGRV